MPRYIDADALVKRLKHSPLFLGTNMQFKDGVIDLVERQPAADAVEVVRCKDCKYRKTPDCKMWYHCVICGDYHHWEKDEYYCSYGEQKEGEEDAE